MLRTLLISAALLATPPARAESPVASDVVERADARRVKAAPGAAAAGAAGAEVDLVFGMGRAAARGFVAAAGGSGDGVIVARGPRTRAALCPGPTLSLP
jgi:hypothetical protein